MSFYVHRIRESDGRNGWVGPIRSEHQAGRERAAWEDAGWLAWVHESSAEVKRAVHAWQHQVHEERAR